jgi:hypothetical protein
MNTALILLRGVMVSLKVAVSRGAMVGMSHAHGHIHRRHRLANQVLLVTGSAMATSVTAITSEGRSSAKETSGTVTVRGGRSSAVTGGGLHHPGSMLKKVVAEAGGS